jgi:LmbE family N-acetylglucosaminyl deacetylase
VVTFDAAEAGTAVSTWLDDDHYRSLPPLELAGVTDLVVVAAHPDDESLGAAGLISTLAATRVRVTVVVVTDGRNSHPESPSHSADEVVRIRRAETVAAIGQLAAGASVRFLDFPDGATPDHREAIAERLAEIVPPGDGTLVVAPWRGDGHRDHREVGEACASVALAAGARLLEYPIWMWHWATPDDPAVPWPRMVASGLDSSVREAKREAISAHRSQVVGLSELPGDGPMLTSHFIRHFSTDHEIFITAPKATPRDYFDDKYARRADPWSLATRWYEQRKRDITMASLPDKAYGSALEIGCSVGLLTAELATRCSSVVAVEISDAAAETARERLSDAANVDVLTLDVAEGLPGGRFDLVMLSEVGYYFDADGLDRLIGRIADALSDTGVVVACHWRHDAAEHPLTGDEVHESLRNQPGWTVIASHREEDFVLEVLSKDARSVARRTGIV